MTDKKYTVKYEIEKAFLSLLTEKPYMDITVTAIVKKAKVARVSFYRNFSSIGDIIDSIASQTIEKFYSEIIPVMISTDENLLREFLSNHFYHLSQNYKETYTLGLQNNEYFSNQISKKMEDLTKKTQNGEIKEKYSLVAKLCFLDGISRKWILDGMIEPPEEIVDYMLPIIKIL